MEVYKWAEIRARRFSPEQIAAIQKEVAEELAKLELLTAPDREAQGEPVQQEVKPTLFDSVNHHPTSYVP